MIPAIPDYVVWVVRNTLYIDKSELSYEYPFTDLSKVSLKPYQVQSLDIPDPFTGKPFFLNRSDAEMIHGDLKRGKDWMVMPYDSRVVVAKKQPSSHIFVGSTQMFEVGQKVRVVGPMDKTALEKKSEKREICPHTKQYDNFMPAMYDYVGKVLVVMSVGTKYRLETKGGLPVGYNWLHSWLEAGED